MADLIDRQTIIETIHKAIYPFFCGAEDGDALSEDEKLVLSVNKAVCTAIKALPSAQPDLQPTCNQLATDCISRQAAIDTLHGYFDGMLETDTWSPCDVYGLIEILPSADIDLSGFSDKLWRAAYERGKVEVVRWIPVSEQLPEDEQEVLFSTKTGWVHLGRYYNDNSVNQWYSSLEKMRAWNNVVNAWMPLPEPYKDGEQDG